MTFPTKVVGTLRVPSAIARFAEEFGERHMECAYYFDFCRTRLLWLEVVGDHSRQQFMDEAGLVDAG